MSKEIDEALDKWLWNLVRQAQDPIHGKKIERLDYTKSHLMEAIDRYARQSRVEELIQLSRQNMPNHCDDSQLQVDAKYVSNRITLLTNGMPV